MSYSASRRTRGTAPARVGLKADNAVSRSLVAPRSPPTPIQIRLCPSDTSVPGGCGGSPGTAASGGSAARQARAAGA